MDTPQALRLSFEFRADHVEARVATINQLAALLDEH